MYSRFQLALKYLNYYFTASSRKGHGIHSPFVFDFIAKVLNDKTEYPEYDKVEKLRTELLHNSTVLKIEDFGAGSSASTGGRRTISSIAKNAAKSRKFGELLFRIIKYYKPSTILELGTSLGISTSYLSLADPGGRVITIEGAHEVLDIARENFSLMGLKNIETVEGNFDQVLEKIIAKLSAIDFAFIDGNHRREPTVRYFKQLLPGVGNESVIVFDDIHWSSEMEDAWIEIKDHTAVTCSIDLFFIGIVFFKREFKEKQHFNIRF